MNSLIGMLLFVDAIQPGVLPRQWRSSCTNYEKPFLYLVFGEDKAFLQDTGAGEADIDASSRNSSNIGPNEPINLCRHSS